MPKTYETIRDYHANDTQVQVEGLDLGNTRVALLTEPSNSIRFVSIDRNWLCLDLTGTIQHDTRMDGKLDSTPTNPGDICLIPPKVDMELEWTIRGPQQHSIAVEFDEDLFSTYAPELDHDRLAKGHLLPSNYAPRPGLEEIIRLLGHTASTRQAQSAIYTDSLLRLLAFEVASRAWTHPQSLREAVYGNDRRIARAIAYIDAHFVQDISLLDISRASGLSPTHLTNLFNRVTGKTPYSYVIDRRIAHAEHLLSRTDLPIAQIAIAAGFSDQQHLTRMFRARRGQTPNSLRQA